MKSQNYIQGVHWTAQNLINIIGKKQIGNKI